MGALPRRRGPEGLSSMGAHRATAEFRNHIIGNKANMQAAVQTSVEKYIPICLAAVISACILAVCYPGFMSYDSIRMLEEARTHVQGGIYPAMPVYILRLFDIGGHGLSVMVFVQNFIVVASLAVFLQMLGVRWYGALIALLAVLAMPTVIGCMLVLWKDVTTTALTVASLVMIFWCSRTTQSPLRGAVKWGALLFLLIATLVRFNAMTATAVVAIYWVATFYPARRMTMKVGAFISILVAMTVSNAVINNYSFPDFRRLAPNGLVYAIMTYDLLGISKWAHVSYLPIRTAEHPDPPRVDLADIDKIYNPLGVIHINTKNQELGRPVHFYPPGFKPDDIVRNWLVAIKEQPIAYLRYRWDLFAELIGATRHATFEPTHFARIDENQFGIKAPPNALADYVTAYIADASATLAGKPWVFLLFSLGATAGVFMRRGISSDLRLISSYATAASVMYLAPIFFMTGTGEVRYTFPSLILSSVPVFVFLLARTHAYAAPLPTRSSTVTSI